MGAFLRTGVKAGAIPVPCRLPREGLLGQGFQASSPLPRFALLRPAEFRTFLAPSRLLPDGFPASSNLPGQAKPHLPRAERRACSRPLLSPRACRRLLAPVAEAAKLRPHLSAPPNHVLGKVFSLTIHIVSIFFWPLLSGFLCKEKMMFYEENGFYFDIIINVL